jgi:hypothetical protein
MMPRHYTYYLIADDPYFEALHAEGLPVLYAGVRSCNCDVNKDPYMGSSQYVKAAMAAGITFSKHIIETHLTRKRANQHEMQILSKLKNDTNPAVWDLMFNRNVPGEFGEFSRIGMIFKSVRKKGYKRDGVLSNRRGGPSSDYVPTEVHKTNVATSVANRWALIRQFCNERDIANPGKGACNVNKIEFDAWLSAQKKLVSVAVTVAVDKGFDGNNPSPKNCNRRADDHLKDYVNENAR